MKLVIASDLHGSATATRILAQHIEEYAPDKVVLLGDVLYHGPRNDLPLDYNPKEVAAILNDMASNIIAVRGNCDAEVDQMVLEFPCMADYALLVDDMLTLYLTHGHLPGKTADDLPMLPAHAAFLSGHTHIKKLEVVAAHTSANSNPYPVVVLNPGSITIPKDASASFALYENGLFTLKSLAGDTLSTFQCNTEDEPL